MEGRTDGRKEGRKEGRTDGSVTISHCNFFGEGIKKMVNNSTNINKTNNDIAP